MNQRRCHRCGSDVPETEGLLVYCSHCGAPQVTLSEELKEQAELLLARQSAAAAGSPEGPIADAVPVDALDWKLLIHLAAAVAGSLTLLSLVLAPFALLVWIWAPIAPTVVLALYAARNRVARMDARCGLRVGVLCGLLVVAGQAIVNTIELDVVRFGLKRAADVTNGVNTVLMPLRTQLMAQYGAQSTAMNSLAQPEFRAGFVLAAFALSTVAIMVLAIAGGAVAGYLRARARAL